MDVLKEITQRLISDSKAILLEKNPTGNYKDFLESISRGLCYHCHKPLKIVHAEESDKAFKYKFSCGHGYNGLSFHEKIVVRDSLKIIKRPTGLTRFISEHIQGWFPSNRVDLSPDGVHKVRVVDREKDYYKEVVTDIKTGRVIRSIEEKLSQHRN